MNRRRILQLLAGTSLAPVAAVYPPVHENVVRTLDKTTRPTKRYFYGVSSYEITSFGVVPTATGTGYAVVPHVTWHAP